MEESVLQFERIRSYILDKMSVEDRVAFERDLIRDKELYAEYEKLKDISRAAMSVRAKEEIRSILSKVEQEHATNPSHVDEHKLQELEQDLEKLDGIEDVKSVSLLTKIKGWFSPGSVEASSNSNGDTRGVTLSYSSRLVLSFAVAAALFFAVFLPVNNHHLAVSGYQEADRLLESGSWQFNTYRSDDVIADKMDNCFAQIHEGKFEEALNSINETEGAIEEKISSLSGDNSALLRISELERAKQELEWQKAVLLMHDKKVVKAKRLLKQIAKSDSIYSGKARKILKEVY